ncbi:hypothetical protein ACNAUY_15430 [Acinetobacter tibetensis]
MDCVKIWLREEITGFNRPNRMEYHILYSLPQAKHEYGQVDLW